MIVYYNNQYLEKQEIRIHPDDRGFLMADGIYEVIRCYNQKPFRLQDHLFRLQQGAETMRFNRSRFPELHDIIPQLLTRNNINGDGNATIYIQINRGTAPRSHAFPPPETPLTIYGYARRFRGNPSEQELGIKAITTTDHRWSRCDIKSIALLANTLAHQKARESGAAEAIFIRDNKVQEGSHSNVFIVKDGQVKTPPLSNTILAGITRKVVIELCNEMGIPCVECQITGEEFKQVDEVFISGTTVEITPIITIDGEPVGAARPGPVSRQLMQKFKQLI